LPVPERPRPWVDAFAENIEEWVGRSRGKVRADVCHQRLVAIGYVGSERATRRAVADAERRWRAEHGRRTRPWIVEPRLWMQWDYGDGPAVAGRRTVGAASMAGAGARLFTLPPTRGRAQRAHRDAEGEGRRRSAERKERAETPRPAHTTPLRPPEPGNRRLTATAS
jgi:hypothetical protein